MQYTFVIKDGRYDSYKKIASSLFLLNAVLFLFIGTRASALPAKIIFILSGILLTGYSIYFWKYRERKEKSYIFIFLFTAAIWIFETPSWYFSLVFLLLLFIQRKLDNDPSIMVTASDISINGFFKSTYTWQELSNVILNGGLLTLDFKNNRILQVEPDWQQLATEQEYPGLEKEFNDFCRQQLNK